MTPTSELISALRALPRVDKLRIIQLLVSELVIEEGLNPLVEGENYQIFSRYDSHEAAHKLEQFLKEHKNTKNA